MKLTLSHDDGTERDIEYINGEPVLPVQRQKPRKRPLSQPPVVNAQVVDPQQVPGTGIQQ